MFSSYVKYFKNKTPHANLVPNFPYDKQFRDDGKNQLRIILRDFGKKLRNSKVKIYT